MQTTLIDQGLDLMLFGMGTVFVFLTILVFATALMSRIVVGVSKSDSDQTEDATAIDEIANNEPSADVLEAIKLAIQAHRQRR